MKQRTNFVISNTTTTYPTQIWEEDGVLWSQEVMTRVCVRGDLTRTSSKLENKLRQQSAR